MRVICINDKNRPPQIPIEQWVKEGEIYTITEIVRLALQSNKLGVLLKEVQIGPEYFPYEYFDMIRFAPYFENVIKEVNVESLELEEV
jgi:hypothetical protein